MAGGYGAKESASIYVSIHIYIYICICLYIHIIESQRAALGRESANAGVKVEYIICIRVHQSATRWVHRGEGGGHKMTTALYKPRV